MKICFVSGNFKKVHYLNGPLEKKKPCRILVRFVESFHYGILKGFQTLGRPCSTYVAGKLDLHLSALKAVTFYHFHEGGHYLSEPRCNPFTPGGVPIDK